MAPPIECWKNILFPATAVTDRTTVMSTFDRVNHSKLFCKLIDRGCPAFIVRILNYWYSTQTFTVRWCQGLSGFFTVCNGVKQGGILSPHLFNVYMDDLSVILK